MAFPPSPGTFSSWRSDRPPSLLAPTGETSGSFRTWRMDRPAALYGALLSPGASLSAVTGGQGALVSGLTAGAPSLGVVIPFSGSVAITEFVPGGALLGTSVAGQGQIAGSVTPGAPRVGLVVNENILWHVGHPLSMLKPTASKTTGGMGFWRMSAPAATLQAGPSPKAPPELFWRLGAAPRLMRPK
jgi:hypothetical protein